MVSKKAARPVLVRKIPGGQERRRKRQQQSGEAPSPEELKTLGDRDNTALTHNRKERKTASFAGFEGKLTPKGRRPALKTAPKPENAGPGRPPPPELPVFAPESGRKAAFTGLRDGENEEKGEKPAD